MMRSTRTVLIACFTSALLAAVPAASAIGSGNIGIGAGLAGVDIMHSLRNHADIDQGGGNGWDLAEGRWNGGEVASHANCQIAILVNTIVTNLAEADGLGLIDDDDTEEFPPIFALDRYPWYPRETPREFYNKTSESDCSQDFGPVLVSLETVPGWGEVSPQGDLASVASALFGGNDEVAAFFNGGGLNLGLGIGFAGAYIEDLLVNEYDIYQGGSSSVFSAANCQILVAYNSMVLNSGSAFGLGEVTDEDTEIFDPRMGGEASLVQEPPNGKEWDRSLDDTNLISTSTCDQSIESLTLILGDGGRLPPQS